MKSFTRFLLLTAAILTTAFGLKAQVSLYTMTPLTGTYTPLSGGTATSLSATADDELSSSFPIGFNFVFNGITYTSLKASSNGLLNFNSTGSSTTSNNLATTTTSARPALAPLWDDLQCSEGVKYELSGTAPNRVLTVEWRNMEWRYGANAPVISFQVILYESTNIIDFVYQQESAAVSTGTASIGLVGVATTDFLSLQNTSANPTTSSSVSTNNISTKPANNQVYRFSPPPFPTVAFSSITPSVANCNSSEARQVSVDASISSGTISSVVLNYAFNGVSQTPITMTNTSGSIYTATIPAATPTNATVTWSVLATSSFTTTATYTGTSYSDVPWLDVAATAVAEPNTVCAGGSSNLSMIESNAPVLITSSAATYMTSTYSGVFYHFYGGVKTQHLYRASELLAAGLSPGEINSLSMFLNVFGGTYQGFAVSIAPTSSTTLSGFNNTALFTEVYSNPSFTTANGENNFPFSSSFLWDGVSNIIVQFCWSNNNGGGTSNVSLVHNPGYTCTAYFRADNQTPSQICGSTSAYSSNSTRPSLKFYGARNLFADSYLWYITGSPSSVGQGSPSTITIPSTNDYFAVATKNGCELTSSNVTVTALALPSAPIATNSTQCGTQVPSASVASSADAAGSGMFYWYDAASNGALLQGPPTQPITSSTCNYTFNLTDASSDGWDGATMDILQGTTVVATIGSSFTGGASATQTVELTAGVSYDLVWNVAGSWSGEVGISVVNPLGTTIFTMTPTSNNPAINTTLTTIVPNCISGYTDIPGSTTYGTALASNTTLYVSELGVNGCMSATSPVSISVSQPAPITYSNSADVICIGSSVSLNMTSTISPPYTYTISSPNPGAGVAANSVGDSQTFTPTSSGNIPYVVTAANGNCTEVDTVNISVVPGASPAPIIANDTLTICPSATTAAFTATASSLMISYTFNLFDSYGDGWNGNALKVLANGVPVDTLTFDDNSAFTAVVNIPEGSAVTTEWISGSYIDECSFNIILNGATIHTASALTSSNISSNMYSGTAPGYNYTFNWYSAATGGTLLGTGATFETIGSSVLPNLNSTGQYIVYAVQSNVCLSPATPAVINVTNVLADIIPVNATCNSVANGTFTLGTISCGVQPFTYSVDGGAFGPIPTDLAYGSHTVVVKDAVNDLMPSVSIFIDQPTWITNVPNLVANGWACKDETSEIISAANPNVSSSVTLSLQNNFAIPGSATVSFTAPVTIPVGATVTSATIQINGLTTTGLTYASDLDLSTTGFGNLTVTPSGNEVINANYTYPLTGVNSANSTLTFNVQNNWFSPASIANVSLVVNYTINQILDNITWFATPTGGTSLGSGYTLETVGTSVLQNTTVPGTYNFYAQGELNGCSSFTRQLVSVTIQAPTIEANMQTATVCPGETLTLSATGGLTYTWSNGAGQNTPFVPAATSYVSATEIYVVNGFDIDGCANQDTVVVSVSPQPILNAGVDQTVCAGTPVILNASTTAATATAVTSFVWDNGVTNNTQYVPTTTTNLTATATGANGCVTQDNVSITVLSLPTVNAGPDQTICAGTGTTLNATGAASYIWNNSVTQGTTFYPTASQIYTVTGIGANGCTNVDEVQVNISTGPSVVVSDPQTVCSNGSAVFSAATINSLGGYWSTSGSGTINPSITSSEVIYSPAANDPANVTLTYIATNACGSNSESTTVYVLALPEINAGSDQAVCSGSQAVLNATGTGFITWLTPNIVNGVGFVPNATATYTAVATASNGCANQDQVTVTLIALPDVAAGDDITICSGEEVILNANGALTYQWTGGVNNGQAFTPNATATYTVTGTTINGCSSTDNVTVFVNATPVAVATVVNDVTLEANSGSYNYQWINCTTGTDVPNASFATFNAMANGNYAVIISTPQGCSDQSDCITIDAVGIQEIELFEVSVQPNPTTGELVISMPSDFSAQAQAQVYDAQGKLVLENASISNGSMLDLTNMTTGVYLVRVSSANSIQTFRVVKQ